MTAIADTRAFDVGEGERPPPKSLLALAGPLWLGVAGLILAWPDAQELERTPLLGALAAGVGAAQLAAWSGGWVTVRSLRCCCSPAAS